jgi:long-chain acyl-CoA synthetase
MELAIQLDPVFEQVLLLGEGKPYLAAVVVLNDEQWARAAAEANLDPSADLDGKGEKLLVQRIAKRIKAFPGYAQVRKVAVAKEKWTIDNGLITPTLKLKRNIIIGRYQSAIEAMYKGHTV